MPTRAIEAPFATAFPSDDPVGHFVIGLAAAHNDLLLTNRFLFPPKHPDRNGLSPAEDVALLRLVLSQIWETHLLVQDASKLTQVDEFIDRLGREYPGDRKDGVDLVAALRGDAGATAPRLRNLLRLARHATNHYEKPNSPRLSAALERLSGSTARVSSGDRMHTLRAEFADDVLLTMALDIDEEQLSELLADAADSVTAIVHLAQTAMGLWLNDHGGQEVQP